LAIQITKFAVQRNGINFELFSVIAQAYYNASEQSRQVNLATGELGTVQKTPPSHFYCRKDRDSEVLLDKSHNKRPTLNALQTWYHKKHPHLPIAISSLSDIISSKNECLDVDAMAK
jgi:Fission yeast centromere protein N-terminal domain